MAQKLPSVNCNVPFSSRACLPIQFASLIRGLVERAAGECFAKVIFASNVYERLGRQALAVGEDVDQLTVVRAAFALKLIEPR
jgi:hypothetical protein